MPNNRIRRFAVNKVATALLAFMTSCALTTNVALADEKRELTIGDVVERGQPSLSEVGWLGVGSLYAHTRAITGERSLRVLEPDGPTGLDLTRGFSTGDFDGSTLRTTSVSPDGKRVIAFVGNQWQTLELETHTASILDAPELPDDLPQAFAWTRADWSRDGHRVAISEMYDARERSSVSSDTKTVNGVRLQETAPASDRVVVLNTRLLFADANDGGKVRSWIFEGCTSAGHSFSPLSDLFVTLTCFEVNVPHTKIIRISLETGEYEEVFRTNAIIQGSSPKISPDGNLIAFALNNDGSNWDAFQDLALIDPKSGEIVQRLRPSENQGLAPSSEYFWAADGKSVYVTARASGLDEVWSLSLSGDHHVLASGDRRRYGMSLSDDGSKLCYITVDGYGYRDVRVFDIDAGEEKIFYVIDDPKTAFALGQWQQIDWESTDGIRPKGWLITPTSFDPESRYPLFVYIHGNGMGSDLYLHGAFTGTISRGPLEWHALAALGYVVFVPDYRTSGNYGPDPIRQVRRDQLDAAVFDARDVAAGVRHVSSLGFVNADRIAVMGHSLGGTRAFKILTDEPTLFGAAVLNESVALDRRSMFESASSGTRTGSEFNRFMRTIYGTDLAEDPEPYKKNYVLDAVRVQTPTLFLRGGYGGNSSPTMYASHETAFTLIRQAGVPTRYITFLDEGHTYMTPAAALVAFDLVIEWLAHHMPAVSGDADFVTTR